MLEWVGLLLATVRSVGWAPIGVLIAHEVLGGLFGHEPYVDPIIHFSGGLAIALFSIRACQLDRRLLGSPSRPAQELIVLGTTVIAALFWEVGEYASDVFRGTNIQRDVGNTMRDLILGTLGGVVSLTVWRIGPWGRGSR